MIRSGGQGPLSQRKGTRTDTVEAGVWRLLCHYNEQGYHFRRKSPYGGFLLDYVEHDIRLVIEWADEARPNPKVARRHVLIEAGYTVLAIRRSDVQQNPSHLADMLKRILDDRPPPLFEAG